MTLFDLACRARTHAYAPYSGFRVGAALRSAGGQIFCGCNIENAAYPEGICAEAGAIAAMIAAGEREIVELLVLADSPDPVPPCGGCRQKIAEFAAPDVKITMATLSGETRVMRLADLLPAAFGRSVMDRG
ncbi:MAG: cytidine deaminase [Rhodobacteraceae bacterium]|nr:cytidine deaminase [Paracoccaceae bacterium]